MQDVEKIFVFPKRFVTNVRQIVLLVLVCLPVSVFSQQIISSISLSGGSSSYSDSRGGDCSQSYPANRSGYSVCKVNCVNGSSFLGLEFDGTIATSVTVPVGCNRVGIVSHSVNCSGSVGTAWFDEDGSCHVGSEGYSHSWSEAGWGHLFGIPGRTPYNVSCSNVCVFSFPEVAMDCSSLPSGVTSSDCLPKTCSSTPSGADSLFTQAQTECEAQGASTNFSGDIYRQTKNNNAEFCVFGACEGEEDNCPPDSNNINMLPKISDKLQNYEKQKATRNFTIESQQQRAGYYYNAKGQVLGSIKNGTSKIRTQSYCPIKNSSIEVQGNDLLVAPRQTNNVDCENRCGVDSLRIEGGRKSLDPNDDINGKIGINTYLMAYFKQGNGYNPACCEYQQKGKGTIRRNDTTLTEANNIGESLSSEYYITDMYGRNYDSGAYIDSIAEYRGFDYPGLYNASYGNSVYIDFHFKSYIQDICNDNKIVSPITDWGFTMEGTVPLQEQEVEIRGVQYEQ